MGYPYSDKETLKKELIYYIEEKELNYMLLDLMNMKVLCMEKHRSAIIGYVLDKIIYKHDLPGFILRHLNESALVNEYISDNRWLIVAVEDDNFDYEEYVENAAFLVRDNQYSFEIAYFKIGDYIEKLKKEEG